MSKRCYERAEAVLERERAAIGQVMKIRFYPFVMGSAEGARVQDIDGNGYLDLIAAAGVVQAGYGHGGIRQAMLDELDRSWTQMHCCYPNERAVELAERLIELAPGTFEKRAWFGTTGGDANDCLARLVPLASGRRRMLTYVGAYHGQTSGSAALSGHSTQARVIGGGEITKLPYPDPYRCLWGPCERAGCSLKCLDFVEQFALEAVSPAADTGAILLEAMQSDGGDVVPPANYLPALRELCDRHGMWLLFDEVKTGLGRTGKMFAFEHAGVIPDGFSLGKPLGGGLPLSGVIARREILDADTYVLSTLGGSPVPCAAGLATLDALRDDRLLENAELMGARLQDGLRELATRHALIGDVRGLGLMVGCELVRDRSTREPATREAAQLAYRAFELGLLVVYCGMHGNVIEFTPPLSITAAEIDEALAILDEALGHVEAGEFDDRKLIPYDGW